MLTEAGGGPLCRRLLSRALLSDAVATSFRGLRSTYDVAGPTRDVLKVQTHTTFQRM